MADHDALPLTPEEEPDVRAWWAGRPHTLSQYVLQQLIDRLLATLDAERGVRVTGDAGLESIRNRFRAEIREAITDEDEDFRSDVLDLIGEDEPEPRALDAERGVRVTGEGLREAWQAGYDSAMADVQNHNEAAAQANYERDTEDAQ